MMRVYEVTCIRKRKQKSQMTEKRYQTKIYSYIYNEQYTFTNTFLFSFQS
ncbi:hypothetical protein HMPREF2534_04333 [Bacteroides thetaiotaomicron]|nr:hypothetical protein HMPREF2534_04333 [Bacteroides thetaiotaomicron]